MGKTVDLNSDLGESFGTYTIGGDERIIPLVTSANLACGMHGGDPVVLDNAVRLCVEHGVAIGAHPGYPDLQGFGRRAMGLTASEADAYVRYQVAAVDGMARARGGRMTHVKLHGALYNRAGADYAFAKVICDGIRKIAPDAVFLALSGSAMARAGLDAGLRVASEVFADRGYEDDGSLVARNKPGAMTRDESEAVKRVTRMVRDGVVETVSGKTIAIAADSICVHGDGEKALAFVERIRAGLAEAGVALKNFVGG
ncbi:MAG: 5-oxoprolinase subunit PxpA [Oscillospiraceae bacterium]|nr:5-oxoprolinase subunit PxpA [Oscillospiraceae bacterium]